MQFGYYNLCIKTTNQGEVKSIRFLSSHTNKRKLEIILLPYSYTSFLNIFLNIFKYLIQQYNFTIYFSFHTSQILYCNDENAYIEKTIKNKIALFDNETFFDNET